jgi:hypothetical protein
VKKTSCVDINALQSKSHQILNGEKNVVDKHYGNQLNTLCPIHFVFNLQFVQIFQRTGY